MNKYVLCITAFSISGCSSVPRLENVSRRAMSEIIENVRCEAKRAVVDYGKYYKTAAIAYEFTFQASEQNNNSFVASWIAPLSPGQFTLRANSGFDLSRSTLRNERIVDTFDQLRAMNCNSIGVPPKNFLYPIAGDIGVYEVVSDFISRQRLREPAAGEVLTSADTLSFSTAIAGGVAPKLVLSRFEASADVRAARSDIHKVVLSLAGSRSDSTQNAAIGSSIRPNGSVPTLPSSLVSTTIIQTAADPRDRALLELDRQRIIQLQSQPGQTLLIGP